MRISILVILTHLLNHFGIQLAALGTAGMLLFVIGTIIAIAQDIKELTGREY
jgi:hypothetical protein